MSTTKKLILFGIILIIILGIFGACAAASSNEPADQPGIEIDVDGHKKKDKKKDSKTKKATSSSKSKR